MTYAFDFTYPENLETHPSLRGFAPYIMAMAQHAPRVQAERGYISEGVELLYVASGSGRIEIVTGTKQEKHHILDVRQGSVLGINKRAGFRFWPSLNGRADVRRMPQA